jgi:hypothetical protein
LHGINVKDILALGLVSEYLMISGQTEDIIDIKRRSPQDIALYGDPVSVPDNHLQNRFEPHQLEMDAGSEATEPRHGSLIVGYIDGIHIVFNHFGLFSNRFRVTPPGGTTF